jgi:hypothetical protein
VWFSETFMALRFTCGTRRGPLCVCKSAIALYLNVIKRDCNQGANKSNRPNKNPSFSSRIPPYTW